MARVVLAFIALVCVSGQECANSHDDEVVMLQKEGQPVGATMAMPQKEVKACINADTGIPDVAYQASQAAQAAAQVAKTKLLKAAQDEYDESIKNINAAKATTLDVATKAYALAKDKEAKIHYDNAIAKATLKAKELLYHDMKHVKSERARAEAEAIALTKVKMEAITRKHQADMDLEAKKAQMVADKKDIAADQNFATARANVLAKTRTDYKSAMQSHKDDITKIRTVTTAKIAALDAAARSEAMSQTAKAAAAKRAMISAAAATLAATTQQAQTDETAAKDNAASKKAVIDAEAANAATTAANEAWVKAFGDEMSFGAPCS